MWTVGLLSCIFMLCQCIKFQKTWEAGSQGQPPKQSHKLHKQVPYVDIYCDQSLFQDFSVIQIKAWHQTINKIVAKVWTFSFFIQWKIKMWHSLQCFDATKFAIFNAHYLHTWKLQNQLFSNYNGNKTSNTMFQSLLKIICN